MTPAELKSIRQKLGLTQAELAAILGYGGVWRISEFERGARDIPRHVGMLMLFLEHDPDLLALCK